MFENIILALVGFGLGILTTVITQIFLRQFRYKDARRAHQLKQLQLIREWMEAERTLFRVKYPDLFEFAFCHKTLVTNAPFHDKKTPEILYIAMKQYLEAHEKVKDAERKGNSALRSLDNTLTVTLSYFGTAPGTTTPNSDVSFNQIPLYQILPIPRAGIVIPMFSIILSVIRIRVGTSHVMRKMVVIATKNMIQKTLLIC